MCKEYMLSLIRCFNLFVIEAELQNQFNWNVYHASPMLKSASSDLNGSQLAKIKKEYSWHVPAMKFIGMKQLV